MTHPERASHAKKLTFFIEYVIPGNSANSHQPLDTFALRYELLHGNLSNSRVVRDSSVEANKHMSHDEPHDSPVHPYFY